MNALLLVDIQNDFLPGGALAVREGDQIIPVVNRIVPRFDLVVATQDWHPQNHGSFASNHGGKRIGEMIALEGLNQILWPDHCVQGTIGAEFSAALDARPVEAVFRKGTDPRIDSYSGFYDNGHRKATGLAPYLKGRGVTDVYVCGLATDYCVKFTALDAVKDGFRVSVVEDACRGVELTEGDVKRALDDMKSAGARIIRSSDIPAAKKEPR